MSISMYAISVPFFQYVSDSNSYNIAYYSSMAGVERALSITRQHGYGLDGSGGWIGTDYFGPISDYPTDDFGIASLSTNSMYRTITGTTQAISGQKLYANRTLIIRPFTKQHNDISDLYNSGNYDIQRFSINNNGIHAHFYLSPEIGEYLGSTGLLISSTDDVAILWMMTGNHSLDPFTIIPRSSITGDVPKVPDPFLDTHIRQSIINNTGSYDPILRFGSLTHGFNPIVAHSAHSIVSGHNTQLPGGESVSGMTFEELFSEMFIEDLIIRFMPNPQYTLLRSTEEGYVYPYLDYYISSDNSENRFSDMFRHIKASSRIGNNIVNIYITRKQD